jgi:hypothetical protein
MHIFTLDVCSEKFQISGYRGAFHGCWLTAVIYFLSSEFEDKVSGFSVQVSALKFITPDT